MVRGVSSEWCDVVIVVCVFVCEDYVRSGALRARGVECRKCRSYVNEFASAEVEIKEPAFTVSAVMVR